jgi:hypothetical protein
MTRTLRENPWMIVALAIAAMCFVMAVALGHGG